MALSQAQQQALNTATPGTQFAQLGTAVGTLQANTQTGAKAFAAGGSRVTNTTTPTPFPGGALSLPANLAQGTIIRCYLDITQASRNASDTTRLVVKAGSVVVLDTNGGVPLATGDTVAITLDLTVETAGAAGKVSSWSNNAIYSSGSGTLAGGPGAATASIDWTAANALTGYVTQSAANAANQTDLRAIGYEIIVP